MGLIAVVVGVPSGLRVLLPGYAPLNLAGVAVGLHNIFGKAVSFMTWLNASISC